MNRSINPKAYDERACSAKPLRRMISFRANDVLVRFKCTTLCCLVRSDVGLHAEVLAALLASSRQANWLVVQVPLRRIANPSTVITRK